MMTNIQIPPAALEEGARALADAYYRNCSDGRLTMADTDDTPEDWYAEARAAFLAMIEAWPGMKTETIFWSNADGNGCGRHTLFLPIMENPDDKD